MTNELTNELTKLYNTLLLIETKGENTKIMAQCLQYLEQMIVAERNKSVEPEHTEEEQT